MTTLLEWKERVIRFCGRNEIYLTPVVKFIAAMAAFLTINHNIGYMDRISSTPAALVLALLCSVLPVNFMILMATFIILLDLYALSLEVCLVAVILFMLIYLLYFRFVPGHGYDVLLTPIFFRLGIPYIMPVGMGLLRSAYAIFSLACGTVVYFFLHGVHENAAVLSGAAELTEDETVSKIVVVLNQLIGNREMYLVLGIMCVTLLIVYLVRRMSIDNSWLIAIISGILFQAIGLIAGYMLLGIEGKIAGVLIGNIVAVLLSLVIQFLFFNLDYSRTERLQFEDDDYYYYVKAVPKAAVASAKKQVRRFGGKSDRDERLAKKQFAEEMDIDEDLLD